MHILEGAGNAGGAIGFALAGSAGAALPPTGALGGTGAAEPATIVFAGGGAAGALGADAGCAFTCGVVLGSAFGVAAGMLVGVVVDAGDAGGMLP